MRNFSGSANRSFEFWQGLSLNCSFPIPEPNQHANSYCESVFRELFGGGTRYGISFVLFWKLIQKTRKDLSMSFASRLILNIKCRSIKSFAFSKIKIGNDRPFLGRIAPGNMSAAKLRLLSPGVTTSFQWMSPPPSSDITRLVPRIVVTSTNSAGLFVDSFETSNSKRAGAGGTTGITNVPSRYSFDPLIRSFPSIKKIICHGNSGSVPTRQH